MKKMNNRGFSLVELLAVVAIMGILFGISIQAYSSYISNSRIKSYSIMVQSAETALNNYSISHPDITCATFEDLYNNQFLDKPIDPGNKNQLCHGKVRFSNNNFNDSSKIDTNTYETYIYCVNYCYHYENNHTKKTKISCTKEVSCEP